MATSMKLQWYRVFQCLKSQKACLQEPKNIRDLLQAKGVSLHQHQLLLQILGNSLKVLSLFNACVCAIYGKRYVGVFPIQNMQAFIKFSFSLPIQGLLTLLGHLGFLKLQGHQ